MFADNILSPVKQWGMQIELIHQTNDAHSPYSYFYDNSDGPGATTNCLHGSEC